MNLQSHDVWTWIVGKYERGFLDPPTSYLAAWRFFSEKYKKGIWDGRIRYINRHRSGNYYFPTGLLPRVLRFLEEREIRYYLDDRRKIEPCLNVPIYNIAGKKLDKYPWDYQGEAVDACLINGRGILQLPTGAGKTLIGCAVMKTLDVPAIWFTHRLNLLYQTKEVMEEVLNAPIGIVGDSKIDYEKFTVGMVQSCSSKKHREFLKTRQVVFGDEIHHLESDLWYSNFAACLAPYRFGLSATPELENEGLSLLGMTGDIIYQRSAKDLVERDVLCQPRIYFARVADTALSNRLDFKQVYKRGIVENSERNQKIVDIAKIFQLEEHNCLILVNRIQHGKELTSLLKRRSIRAKFIYGQTSKSVREASFSDLFSGKLDTVVATAPIVGEGVDFPQLRCLINATGGKGGGDSSSDESGRLTIQIIGRGMRKHEKKDGFDYVDFLDTSHKYLKNAARDRLRTLRAEGWTDFIGYWEERSIT